jgi:aqualysin 1
MKKRVCSLLAPGILLVLILGGCSKQTADLTGEQLTIPSPDSSLILKSGVPDWLKDSYIVAFNDEVKDVDAVVGQIEKNLGVKANFVYKFAIKGFAAKLPEAALNGLKNNPHVKYIEQEQVYTINTTQSGVTWGIDRIDQRSLPLSTTYTYNQDGSGVDAYIIDTGIRLTHVDFGGRAVSGYNSINPGTDAIDDHGHGTHVSGTVGGATYGVAKNVHLIAVKVLNSNGSGTTSTVVAGIDWAIKNHLAGIPAVANMSLGGGGDVTIDTSVKNAVADGIVMCVAAGNSAADASNYSPARVAEAITVGASTSADGFASYSNYGSIVDILAPGSSVTSDYYLSNTSTATMSGTSMATPHVAGVAALYLQANPTATPAEVSNGLKAIATSATISSLPAGTTNLLLYSVIGSTPPPTPPAAPTLASPANGSSGIAVNPSLTWNSSGSATSYRVEVATDINFKSTVWFRTGITATSVNVTGLSYNTIYYWRVNATNGGGTGEWSEVWNFKTMEGALPQAPTLISPPNGAKNLLTSVSFDWSDVSGILDYNLQISRSNTFGTLELDQKAITVSDYQVTGLSKGTRYYWRVVARNNYGTSTSSSRNFTTVK